MNGTHRTNRERRSCALLLALLPLACATGSHPARRDTVHQAAPGAIGPYSGAVLAGGFCFVAGKIGERGQGFAHEVETAIDAIEAQLAEVGLGLEDAVQAIVYLTDMGRYAELNEIYARRFPEPYPARVCIAVAALPGNALVEIHVTARR